MAQLRFFMGISDSMLAFYSTQLLETNTYKKWSLVINSYSFIQPTIATVRSAKFPRIFTTIRSRSRLRDSIIQLLLDITDYEMYKLASKKRVESVLLSHSEGEYSEGSFLYEIWDTYKQRELGDSGTFLRLLEFLEYELQSIEGTNAEVVGAIAGVIVGAILTLIITLINS